MTENGVFTYVRAYKDIRSKAIPEPHLLIKGHKDKVNNEFPNETGHSGHQFAAAFSKIGYLGIKRIFDANNIEYARYTITQASDLKSKLEKLQIKKGQGTI
eukprot:14145237-Ditylum_brightwellii.AAC.1